MSKRTQAPWREGALIPRTVNGTPMYEITIFTAEHIPAAIFTLRSTDPERVKANAEFIVKAANAHQDLIEAIWIAVNTLRMSSTSLAKKSIDDACTDACNILQDALTKAEADYVDN